MVDDVAARMASSARAWLELLTDDQRAIAMGEGPYAEGTDSERRRWFYTPTDHGGLTFHQQRPAQQRAAMKLVASGLSRAGYVTVATTIGLENVLDHTEGFVARFDRERGRDPGLYYLRVFGEPDSTGTWGWRFGGHHVSLNNLVVDGRLVSTTPCFMGADPAVSELLGGAVNRPLARVEDLARELVRSLSPDDRRRAVLSPKAPSDLVTGNRTDIAEGDRVIPLAGIWRDERFSDPVEWAKLQSASDAIDAAAAYGEPEHRSLEYTAEPKGIPGSALNGEQRELLYALLGTYFGRVPEAVSPLSTYDDAALDLVHVAWAGSTEPGAPHYYRVQGPKLLLEWDNTQRNANHAHSVWRNPSNDFGLDVLGAHRRAHH
ncbi:DUF3500 domain-containing protein [Actinoplanes sp. Pm04-4]|uniref:DUF3500 domain-containing protein n=1 Tax=Paractinoplanes pyxinae TaxID=2997416 RepID=A0ABT4AZG2_9ACTN|nr:DUF3500 domain-containing protein [Actinoplanes pyxinae]MCY1139242.1 DUF3500 domain-containing protein [Actinoplanes pyxinae]